MLQRCWVNNPNSNNSSRQGMIVRPEEGPAIIIWPGSHYQLQLRGEPSERWTAYLAELTDDITKWEFDDGSFLTLSLEDYGSAWWININMKLPTSE